MRGLVGSRYGIVIFSPSFFKRTWPGKELDGLEAREAHGKKVILPVWHGLTADEVAAYSPTLAARVAAQTKHGIAHVADAIGRTRFHSECAFVPDARLGSSAEHNAFAGERSCPAVGDSGRPAR